MSDVRANPGAGSQAVQTDIEPRSLCGWCGGRLDGKRADARFCSERCRLANSQSRSPVGTVKAWRKLAKGGVSVVIHFPESEYGRAERFEPRQRVALDIVGKDGA